MLYIGLIIEMGCIFSEIVNNEILDYTLQGPEYDYLRPTRTITVEIDKKWKVPVSILTLMVGHQLLFNFGLKIIPRRKIFKFCQGHLYQHHHHRVLQNAVILVSIQFFIFFSKKNANNETFSF